MVPKVVNQEGGTGTTAGKLELVMDVDRILGALIWCVWNDQLPDDLLELIRNSSAELPKYLAGNKDPATDLIAMAQGYLRNFDPDIRDVVIANMKKELVKITEARTSSQ